MALSASCKLNRLTKQRTTIDRHVQRFQGLKVGLYSGHTSGFKEIKLKFGEKLLSAQSGWFLHRRDSLLRSMAQSESQALRLLNRCPLSFGAGNQMKTFSSRVPCWKLDSVAGHLEGPDHSFRVTEMKGRILRNSGVSRMYMVHIINHLPRFSLPHNVKLRLALSWFEYLWD